MSLAPPEEEDNERGPSGTAGHYLPEDAAGDYLPEEDSAFLSEEEGDYLPEDEPIPSVEIPREGARRRRPTRPSRGNRLRRQAERLSTLSIAALANILVIAILAAGLIFTIVRLSSENSTDSMRSSALAAARTYGVYLSSYDYKNLNGPGSPWAEVDSHATPKFRKAFTQTSGDLAKLLTQYDATAKGKVVDAGLSSLHGSKAVVLLFIDQEVTNTVQKPNTVIQPLRVRVTLVNQGGRWLIDNLEVPK